MKLKEMILAVILFLIDQVSKYITVAKLAYGSSVTIIENFFYLTLVRNTGAAWGLLSGKLELFFVATIAAVGVILYLLVTTKEEGKKARFPLILMLAGSLGNFYDRVVFGYVRDFLDFWIFGYDYPVFNFADICLCIGVALLVIEIIRNPED